MKQLYLIAAALIIVLSILLGVFYYFRNSKKEGFTGVEMNKQLVEVQEKKIEEYSLKIEENSLKIEEVNNNAENLDSYRELYDLYHDGIDDEYDIDGNKIKGLEPDPTQAVFYLKEIIGITKSFRDKLDLANLFYFGMHKLEPDLKSAEMYYNDILTNCNDPEVFQEAEEKLVGIRSELNMSGVFNWLNIKNPKTVTRMDEYNRRIVREEIRPTPRQDIMYPDMAWRTEDTDIAVIRQIIRREEVVVEEAETVVPDNGGYQRDSQNVHDSQVLSTIRHSLDKLKKVTDMNIPMNQSLKQIREFIEGQKDNDKKTDALLSFDNIEKNTSAFSSIPGTKEVDAINLVWNRINSDAHQENLEDTKNMLFEQLASMQEHGHIVCATGRITRIVDTLNVIDPEVTIKSRSMINREMMNKSADIRTKLLDTYSDAEKKSIDDGNDGDFDQKLKDTIREELSKDYVETKILSKDKFDTELGKWIDYI